jgi:membrane protein implicated in regulation of membrane protease activity
MFQRGAFAWNGAIAWWINMVVFVLYTGVFLTLLRRMIQREDFGIGPLPNLPGKHVAVLSDSVCAAS